MNELRSIVKMIIKFVKLLSLDWEAEESRYFMAYALNVLMIVEKVCNLFSTYRHFFDILHCTSAV